MASFDFWRVHVGVGQTWSLQNSLKWVYRFFWGTSPRRAPFPSWNHAAKEGENFYCTYHDWNLAELELHQSHQVWDVIGVGFWKELDEEIDLKILWKLEDRTLICLVSSNCNFCWKDTARSPIFDGWIIVFASSIHHFGWFNFIFHCPYSTTMKYHRHPSIFPGKNLHFSPRFRAAPRRDSSRWTVPSHRAWRGWALQCGRVMWARAGRRGANGSNGIFFRDLPSGNLT